MRKRILISVAAIVLAGASPAGASLYFDWVNPLRQLGTYPSSYGAAYNPPGVESDTGPGWYELGWGDGYDFFEAGFPTFILNSNSGKTGPVPVKIEVTLSGNVGIDEDNAVNTEFQVSQHLSYGIESLDGLYGREFDIDAEFLNETAYSRTAAFLDFFEIGKPYRIGGELINFPPVWKGATPVNPDDYAFSIIYNEAYGDIALRVVPEPATILLFASGGLGMWLRRKKKPAPTRIKATALVAPGDDKWS